MLDFLCVDYSGQHKIKVACLTETRIVVEFEEVILGFSLFSGEN